MADRGRAICRVSILAGMLRNFLGCALLCFASCVFARGQDASPAAASAPAQDPPAQAAPTDSSVYRPGNGVTPPSVISAAEPDYPEAARKKNLDGTALVTLIVGPEGRAHDVKIVRSTNAVFEQPAVDAVKSYLFHPGMKDGKPVPVILKVEVVFHSCGVHGCRKK